MDCMEYKGSFLEHIAMDQIGEKGMVWLKRAQWVGAQYLLLHMPVGVLVVSYLACFRLWIPI